MGQGGRWVYLKLTEPLTLCFKKLNIKNILEMLLKSRSNKVLNDCK